MRVGEISESQHTIKAVNIHKADNRDRILIILYTSKTHSLDSLPQKIKICGKSHLEVFTGNDTTRVASKKYLKDCHFCPVEWTKLYIQNRPPIQHEQEQFFIFQDGSNLQATHLRQVLRSILEDLHLEPTIYDPHSFRIGRATDLFKYNTSIDKIKELGRWKSNAVYKYLRGW